jgi:hypothetical protein
VSVTLHISPHAEGPASWNPCLPTRASRSRQSSVPCCRHRQAWTSVWWLPPAHLHLHTCTCRGKIWSTLVTNLLRRAYVRAQFRVNGHLDLEDFPRQTNAACRMAEEDAPAAEQQAPPQQAPPADQSSTPEDPAKAITKQILQTCRECTSPRLCPPMHPLSALLAGSSLSAQMCYFPTAKCESLSTAHQAPERRGPWKISRLFVKSISFGCLGWSQGNAAKQT